MSQSQNDARFAPRRVESREKAVKKADNNNNGKGRV